jgi:hypothetical protein
MAAIPVAVGEAAGIGTKEVHRRLKDIADDDEEERKAVSPGAAGFCCGPVSR